MVHLLFLLFFSYIFDLSTSHDMNSILSMICTAYIQHDQINKRRGTAFSVFSGIYFICGFLRV